MKRTQTHVEFLDYIRGLAILAVFFFHCLASAFGHDQLPWDHWFRSLAAPASFLALLPATYGWAGVSIFFVVSGFCIHLSYLRGTPGDWRGFFVRRFFRIYPPYLFALLFFVFLLPTTRLPLHASASWVQFTSHLLLVHNLTPSTFFGIDPSFWSIAVEVQLYLIYPALLFLTGRLGWRKTLILLASVELLMRAAAGLEGTLTGSDIPNWLAGLPLYYWFSWAIGAALADAFVKGEPLPFLSSPPLLWLLLGLGVYLVKPLAPLSFTFFALATVALSSRLLRRTAPLPVPRPNLGHLNTLGLWSYSFYLLHQPLIGMVPAMLSRFHRVLPPLGTFILCLCTYPALLLLSSLYYKHCELHSIAFGKLFLRKKHPPLTPVLEPHG